MFWLRTYVPDIIRRTPVDQVSITKHTVIESKARQLRSRIFVETDLCKLRGILRSRLQQYEQNGFFFCTSVIVTAEVSRCHTLFSTCDVHQVRTYCVWENSRLLRILLPCCCSTATAATCILYPYGGTAVVPQVGILYDRNYTYNLCHY